MKIVIIKLLTKTALRLYRLADRMLQKEIGGRYYTTTDDKITTKRLLNALYGGATHVNH